MWSGGDPQLQSGGESPRCDVIRGDPRCDVVRGRPAPRSCAAKSSVPQPLGPVESCTGSMRSPVASLWELWGEPQKQPRGCPVSQGGGVCNRALLWEKASAQTLPRAAQLGPQTPAHAMLMSWLKWQVCSPKVLKPGVTSPGSPARGHQPLAPGAPRLLPPSLKTCTPTCCTRVWMVAPWFLGCTLSRTLFSLSGALGEVPSCVSKDLSSQTKHDEPASGQTGRGLGHARAGVCSACTPHRGGGWGQPWGVSAAMLTS